MSHTPKFHADDGSERIKAIRAEFEQHYVCNVSDYSRHPLGSQRCGDQWRGWLAAWTQRETESTGLLSLLYDIRAAAGDNEGRLMQSELVELIAGMVDISKCSQTTQSLICMLIDRDRLGRAKYGKTLDRTDLTHAEWLQHMAEEMLDGAG